MQTLDKCTLINHTFRSVQEMVASAYSKVQNLDIFNLCDGMHAWSWGHVVYVHDSL